MLTYCTRCVMPDTKPDLRLDDHGICNACRSYENRKEVDWEKRHAELLQVLDRYRKIDGSNCEQFSYNVWKNMIAGGPNLIIYDNKHFTSSTIYLDEKYKNKKSVNEKHLFHLLTDKKTFKVNNVEFGDYNSSIDFFIN